VRKPVKKTVKLERNCKNVEMMRGYVKYAADD